MGRTRYVFAGTRGDRDGLASRDEGRGVKTCPRCGQVLFSDMDVCYGCLYDFTRDGGPTQTGARAGSVVREGEAWGAGMRSTGADPGLRGRTPSDVTARQEGAGQGTGASRPALPSTAWQAPETNVVPGAELLDDMELDELDDDLDRPSPEEARPEEPRSVPRHGRRTQSADDTLDLGSIRMPQTTQPEVPVPQYWVRIETPSARMEVPLPSDGLVVGRDEGCDVMLKTRAVSRRHLRLEPCAEGARAHDLGATNPALLRGEPLDDEGLMRVGDALDVCDARLTLAVRS